MSVHKKEEKKYFQLSPETIPLLAETIGINGNTISPSVSRALAEDVSYRCRELANVNSNHQQFYEYFKIQFFADLRTIDEA